MLSLNKKILYTTVFLFILSCVYFFIFNKLYESPIRLIGALIMFGYFLIYTKKNIYLLLVFVLITLSTICYFYYELGHFKFLTSILKIITGIIIIIHIYPKQKLIKLSLTEITVFSFLILLNFYLIYLILYTVNLKIDIMPYNIAAMAILGVSHIILTVFALKYRSIKNKPSIYLLAFVSFIVLGDITSLLEHIFEYSIIIFINRAFFLFGLYHLVMYSLSISKLDD